MGKHKQQDTSFLDELADAMNGEAGGKKTPQKDATDIAIEAWLAGHASNGSPLPSSKDTPVAHNIHPVPSASESTLGSKVGGSYPAGPSNGAPTGGGYGGYGYGGSGSSSSSSSGGAGRVWIAREDGTLMGPWTVPWLHREWWDEAKKHYAPLEGSIVIPKACVEFSYESVKFNGCVFTATDDYMTARWGRKLHSSDRDWLAEHPLATDDGIPMEYMPTCIHQMLEPYGMAVSAVRIRRGTLAAGPQLQQFMDALGINPFAMIDRETSNAAAAKKLGMTEAEANKLWRVEFHDEPLIGCTIVGEKGWANSNGVSTGSMGGHSRYLAPRAKPGNWSVSVQVAPAEAVEYLVPLVSPEYVPRKGAATPVLESIKIPDGSAPVAVKFNGTYYSPEVAKDKQENFGKPKGTAGFQHGSGESSTGSTSTTKVPSFEPIIYTVPGPKPKVGTPIDPFGSKGSHATQTYGNGFLKSEVMDHATGTKTVRILKDSLQNYLHPLVPFLWLKEAREHGASGLDAAGEPIKLEPGASGAPTAVQAILENIGAVPEGTVTQLSLVDDVPLVVKPVPAPMEAVKALRADELSPFDDPDAPIFSDSMDMVRCSGLCGLQVKWDDCVFGTDICEHCYNAAWQGYMCPPQGCGVSFSNGYSPYFEGRVEAEGKTFFTCPDKKCKQKILVRDDDPDPRQAAIIDLARRCPDMSAEEFDELAEECRTFAGLDTSGEEDVEGELRRLESEGGTAPPKGGSVEYDDDHLIGFDRAALDRAGTLH